MKFTQQTLFENTSEDVRKLNPELFNARKNNHQNPAQKPPLVERAARSRALGKKQTKKTDPRRFFVTVTDVRKRLLDDDNLAEKYHVDCCRYAGLIHSDAGGTTKITTSQRAIGEGEEPHIIIEIETL